MCIKHNITGFEDYHSVPLKKYFLKSYCNEEECFHLHHNYNYNLQLCDLILNYLNFMTERLLLSPVSIKQSNITL